MVDSNMQSDKIQLSLVMEPILLKLSLYMLLEMLLNIKILIFNNLENHLPIKKLLKNLQKVLDISNKPGFYMSQLVLLMESII